MKGTRKPKKSWNSWSKLWRSNAFRLPRFRSQRKFSLLFKGSSMVLRLVNQLCDLRECGFILYAFLLKVEIHSHLPDNFRQREQWWIGKLEITGIIHLRKTMMWQGFQQTWRRWCLMVVLRSRLSCFLLATSVHSPEPVGPWRMFVELIQAEVYLCGLQPVLSQLTFLIFPRLTWIKFFLPVWV